jgi:uncharacterized protein DUF935
MPEKSKRNRLPAGAIEHMLLPFQNGIKPSWTHRQIRSALTQHQMGLLGQSSLLFDSMLEDDEFPSTLKRRCDATLRSKFCLKPVEKEPKFPKAKKPDGKDPSQDPESADPEGETAAPPAAPEPAPPPPVVEKTVKRKSDGSREETVKEKPGAAPEPIPQPAGPPEPVEPIEVASKLKPHQRRAEELWPIMAPYGELLRIDADLLVMGVSVGTLDWDTRSASKGGQSDGLWVPTLRALPTEFLRYDHGERCWKYQAQEAARQWDPSKGKLPSMLEGDLGSGELQVKPGDGKWVLITLGQRGWLWGLVRGLAGLWYGKQETYCNWQRYNQKHGLPIVKAVLPIQGDADEKEDFVDDLGSVVREGIIGLPQDEEGYGYDVELLEPTTVTWQGFEAALARDDRKMQIALLGGNLGAEVAKSGGNMGAAETHSGELQKLAAGDAQILGESLKEQLLRPFFTLNFGPEKCKDMPLPYWDTCPEEDCRSWTTAQGQLAVTIKTFGEAGYEIMNLGDVAADFGLMLAKKPASTMAPPPGGPGADAGAGSNGDPGQKAPAKPGAPGAANGSTAK